MSIIALYFYPNPDSNATPNPNPNPINFADIIALQLTHLFIVVNPVERVTLTLNQFTTQVVENDGTDDTQQPMTHMYAVEWNLSEIEVGYDKQLSPAHQYFPLPQPCNIPLNILSMDSSIRGSRTAPTGVLLCVEGPSRAQVMKP